MLYPIELLRHSLQASESASENGVHVNDLTGFCHVVIILTARRPNHP